MGEASRKWGAAYESLDVIRKQGQFHYWNYPGGGNNRVRLTKAVTSEEEVTHIKKKQNKKARN